MEHLVVHVEVPDERRWCFGQEVGEGGPADFWYLGMGPGGPPDTPDEVPEEDLAREARYWENYGTRSWEGPRLSDWGIVVTSGDSSRREWEDWAAHMGQPLNHAIFTAAQVAPGRHAVIAGLRDGWGTYSEREQGYLELLKPHFMQAWLTSCVPTPRLTPAQRRVPELVRRGHTNRQVARDLGISESIVRTHLEHAYASLGVDNRVAAVAAAFGSAGGSRVPAQRREAGQ